MRAKNRLTALEIKNFEPGKYADGGGLWLHKRNDGGAQWFLRVTVHGRRREMGLGSLEDVSLREVREAANQWKSILRQGKDPIKERNRLRRQADKSDTSLRTIAEAAFEARKAELKNDGQTGRWFSPLELHVLPKLGKVPVEELDQMDIKTTMAPIWHTKGDTARKAIGRLGIVIKHAAAMGLEVDIQAVQKAKALLGKSRHQAKHIPALPWQDIPAYYASLNQGTQTQLALRLLILTAVRSGSLRNARWEQIEENTWTIPAENMKGNKGKTNSFRVPLSNEALSVLSELNKFERNGFVFPGQRKGIMSDMTMTGHMSDQGLDARPHGFRTSFRTWCAETTDMPREVAEAALAHSSGSKTELSYMRSDFLERRRIVMERWASFVIGKGSEITRLVSKTSLQK